MNDIFLIQGSTLKDTAETIRDHIGGDKIAPKDFPKKIEEVYNKGKKDTMPNLQDNKSVTPTAAGFTVEPAAGYDGLRKVTVEAAPLQTKNITTNGEHKPESGNLGFSSVFVNVPNTCDHTFEQKTVTPATVKQTFDAARDDGCSGYDIFTVEAMPTGSVEVTGGDLTRGAGRVAVQGNNVTLQQKTGVPSSSEYYIAAQGSGTVKRAAITKTQTEGYISAVTNEVSAETSESSATATEYYTIPAGDITIECGIADTTVNTKPGEITINEIDRDINGKTQIGTDLKTTPDFDSKYYIAVKAESESNTATATISGAARAKVSTSGYVTAGDHPIASDNTVTATATANVAEETSSDYYLPIQEGSVEVTGGDLTVQNDKSLNLFAPSPYSLMFEATEESTPSGAYITLLYNNVVTRDAIEVNTEAGYILDSTDEPIKANKVYLTESSNYKIKDAGGWYAERPLSSDGCLTFKIGASTAGIINGEANDSVSLEDSNFTASNIKAGTSIFGLKGACLSWESGWDKYVEVNTVDSTEVRVFTSSLDGNVRNFVSSDSSIATGDWFGPDDSQEMYVRGHKAGDCVIIVTSDKGSYKVLRVHVAQAE
jgi:hypothetical protein